MSIPTDASPSSQTEQKQATQPQTQPTKRSSRRANTAERRATHNAVERLRRETLNGRFLDLAAMLPALTAQRRPSKSAIVNQSIALINNQRRSRIIAARELRLIKAENDALRQELNEWRGRNSLPRVEEPPRSADLIALLAVEEEAEGEEMMTMMMNSRRAAFEMGDDEDYNDDGDDEQLSPESAHPYSTGPAATTIPTIGHTVHSPVHHQHQQHHQQQAHYAAAAQQQAVIFEQQKAAMARAQMVARASYPQQQQQHVYATDNYYAGNMYVPEYSGAPAWSQKAASTLATPPGTSHGHGHGMKNEPPPYANTAFLSSSPYGPLHHQQGGVGIFKPGGQARSEDGDSTGESAGSSHFSSVSDLSASLSNGVVMAGSSSPVDYTCSFNMGMMNGVQMPMNVNMNMVPMMGMNMNGMNMGMSMPSPPHSASPGGSQSQSRRPSVNIPASYASNGNGSKHASPNASPGPTATPSQAQFVSMGLMM